MFTVIHLKHPSAFNFFMIIKTGKNMGALDSIKFKSNSELCSCQVMQRKSQNVHSECLETCLYIVADEEIWICSYERKTIWHSTLWIFQNEQNPSKFFIQEALQRKGLHHFSEIRTCRNYCFGVSKNIKG